MDIHRSVGHPSGRIDAISDRDTSEDGNPRVAKSATSAKVNEYPIMYDDETRMGSSVRWIANALRAKPNFDMDDA